MRITILPLAVAISLTACGSERSGEFTTSDGETGEYTIDESSGETTATIETSEGTAVLRSGENVAVDLPDGFSIYPGAKVINNTVVDHADGKGSMIILETGDSIADVKSFYREQAEAAGVNIEIEADINGGAMLGGKTEQGDSFMLTANRDDDVTSATLLVGQELGN